MKKLTFAVFTIVLASCATSTGVVPMGQGTYSTTIEHRGFGASMGDAKVIALNEAATFCKDKGGDFQVLNQTDVPRAFGQFPNSSIQFKCVAK